MYWILASASPRRAEILGRCGSFTVCPANADETVAEALSPTDTVKTLSRRKAEAVFEAAKNKPVDGKVAGLDIPILGADTLVELNGKLLGKPKNAEDAAAMLRALSGKKHAVHTGITVFFRGKAETASESTEVLFRALSEEEIAAYVATGEPFDKAGAYGIQEIGSLLVESINGDYDNVVGLPLAALYRLMRERFSVSFAEFIG